MKAIGFIVLVMIVFAAGIFSGLYLTGHSFSDLGELVKERIQGTVTPAPLILRPTKAAIKPTFSTQVALSADQEMLVDAFGYPSDFFIVLNEAEGVRFEIWQYSDLLKSFSFENGVFQNMTKMTAGGSPVKTLWRPTHFPSDFDRKWTEVHLGEPDDVVEMEVSPVGKVETLNYGGQLLVTFLEGKAIGVQTVFGITLAEQYYTP